MDARAFASDLAKDLIELRRDIHRHPEVGLDLPLTQRRVLRELQGLGLEITRGKALSSITAVLRGGAPGRPHSQAPVVLLRADMDALAVQEENDLEYASEIPGAMHACGHDLHTSMLVGAARTLAAHRHELAGDVVFMFQPGEELHDGAALMVAEGVLDAAGRRADAAYALHVFTGHGQLGSFSTRAETIMSAADTLKVTVIGRGGHSSAPYRAIDPVPLAAEMVLALQSFTTRRFDVFDPVVIGIGAISGGDLDAPNAIPERVRFNASVRSWSTAARERFHNEVGPLLAGIAGGHRAQVEVEVLPGYPATITDPAETEFTARTIAKHFGAQRFTRLKNPLSCSEDFSRVLAEVPGSFIVLSAPDAVAGQGEPADNHSAKVRFSESVLTDGAALYAQLAADRLAELAGGTTALDLSIPAPSLEKAVR
ncbi:M20 family metallopeptidase [Glutamicibacter arilaitensis]|uniref:M20 metallopeptidase family protein n=1 Tax=Glutamicibacter arilaitensis TaxID=256701 RepID=UPI00384C29FD